MLRFHSYFRADLDSESGSENESEEAQDLADEAQTQANSQARSRQSSVSESHLHSDSMLPFISVSSEPNIRDEQQPSQQQGSDQIFLEMPDGASRLLHPHSAIPHQINGQDFSRRGSAQSQISRFRSSTRSSRHGTYHANSMTGSTDSRF